MQASAALQIAGKTRVYNTDGTGRDTYIGFNNGGNTASYNPTLQAKSGLFRSPGSHFRRGDGSGGKKLHYQVDGSGRDSYIHITDGGFTSKYGKFNERDAYVASLRGYQTSQQGI